MMVCPACGKTSDPGSDMSVPQQCPHCRQQVLAPHYCELTRIGAGAMGEVYRARRPDMANRSVAIKIPRDKSAHFQQRFEREITASALLNHPNIVQAFDRGTIDGRAYLVMEFVEGNSLGDIVRRDGPLSALQVARLLRDVASGLAHAATRGIVNRDIKPDNILISTDGSAKILDYGLAMVPSTGDSECVTRSGVLLGTPSFMAPEQFHDPHGVTVQADVYSLGCTGFYALTGKPPFVGEGASLAEMHSTWPRPSAPRNLSSADFLLDELLRQMMAVSPQGRPKPAELVQRLERVLQQTSQHADAVAVAAISTQPDSDDLYPLVGEVIVDEADAPPPLETDASFPTVEMSARPARSEASSDEEVFIGVVEVDIPPLPDAGAPAVEGLPSIEVIDGVAVDGGAESPIVGEVDDPPAIPFTGSQSGRQAGQRWRMPEVVEGVDPGATGVDTLPASAIVNERNWDAPPPIHSEGSKADADVAVLPASAVVGPAGGAQAPQGSVRPKPSIHELARARRNRLLCFMAASVALVIGLGGAAYFLVPGPDADAEWAAAQEEYQLKKWKAAASSFKEFAETHPDHPRTTDVPFFLDMCEAGPHIFSQTGDIYAAFKTIDSVFQEYRDTPQYEAYCADLYQFLQRLVERSVEQADKTRKPVALEPGLKSQELLATVALSMPDAWVPKKTAELAASLEAARGKLIEHSAKDELLSLLSPERTKSLDSDALDATYEQVQKVLTQHPELRQDKSLEATLAQQYSGELARVSYEPITGPDPVHVASYVQPTDATDVQLTWGTPIGPRVTDNVYLALARGVLYAFDANGNLLWSRRLGIDSDRLPIAVPGTENSPAAFIAVSSLDNKLVALSQATGHVLWQYSAQGQELSAPLTITRWRPALNRPEMVRGLLPTAAGEIHVIELSRGKRIGTFKTGVPMTVGGTFDPVSQLAFFPADSKRVFAIDPEVIENQKSNRSAARSVLFTNHGHGALRSPPIIVGQYLTLIETSELENTLVRVFEIKSPDGFPKADAAPLKEVALRGWTWFNPPTLPDRITVVTDDGELGAFGVNLDNPAEALYHLIEQRRGTKSPLQAGNFRSLAVQSDEYLLWTMAGGRLQHLSLDLLNQRWRTLWPADNEPTITGIPLHEAAIDPLSQRIYLATRALSGQHHEFTAVHSETGSELWRHQLGVIPAADPYLMGDEATIVDCRGRLLKVAINTQGESIVTQRDGVLPPPGANGELIFAGQDSSAALPTLVVPLGSDRSRLAIRDLQHQSPESEWTEISLPGVQLQGRPAVLGKWIVVPCSDGRMHRLPLGEQADNQLNEQPFAWSSQATVAPDELPTLTPLSETMLLITHGREARWLQLSQTSGVTHWKQHGPTVLTAGRLLRDPLVTSEYVFLADDESTIYRVPRMEPTVDPVQWKLSEPLSTGPFLLRNNNELVFAVVGSRKIVCFPSGASHDATPLWQAKTRSRICGTPAALGKYLLVTEERGRLTGIRLENGETAASIQLGPGIMPAAAAVPLGRGRVLVPLVDGTLLWTSLRPKPAPSAQGGTL